MTSLGYRATVRYQLWILQREQLKTNYLKTAGATNWYCTAVISLSRIWNLQFSCFFFFVCLMQANLYQEAMLSDAWISEHAASAAPESCLSPILVWCPTIRRHHYPMVRTQLNAITWNLSPLTVRPRPFPFAMVDTRHIHDIEVDRQAESDWIDMGSNEKRCKMTGSSSNTVISNLIRRLLRPSQLYFCHWRRDTASYLSSFNIQILLEGYAGRVFYKFDHILARTW